MSDTDELVLEQPTVVAIHAAGLGRIRVEFPAGKVEPTTPEQEAAAAWLHANPPKPPTERVPDNVDDVKEWVGDDQTRAAFALEVERSRSAGPRKTLEPWLVEAAGLAAGDDAGDGDTGEPGT